MQILILPFGLVTKPKKKKINKQNTTSTVEKAGKRNSSQKREHKAKKIHILTFNIISNQQMQINTTMGDQIFNIF